MVAFPRIFLVMAAVASSSTAYGFDLQGHRGARGLAPENTLAAFAAALKVGVTTLELDLAMTKDGVLVVHHDLWLNPNTTRGADGAFLAKRGPAIRSLTLDELSTYDVGRLRPTSPYATAFPAQQGADGERIPTLAKVFKLAAKSKARHVRFNLETKLSPTAGEDAPDPETFAAAVAAAVRDAGLSSRVTVQSFDWRTLVAMQKIAPDIARVCLTIQSGKEDTIARGKAGPSPWTAGLDVDDVDGSTPRLVAQAGCAVWSPAFMDLSAERVTEAHTLGLKVIPWTVNIPAQMTRLLDMGVDGIITDYPDRLRLELAARNIPLPPAVNGR